MTERERLIVLVKDIAEDMVAVCGDSCDDCKHGDCVGKLADHLLANGIIVPPCKVGDAVYYLTTVDTEKELNVAKIFCGTVLAVSVDEGNMWVSVKYNNGLYYCHKSKEFGKTVFLSREDAEKALKARSEKNG